MTVDLLGTGKHLLKIITALPALTLWTEHVLVREAVSEPFQLVLDCASTSTQFELKQVISEKSSTSTTTRRLRAASGQIKNVDLGEHGAVLFRAFGPAGSTHGVEVGASKPASLSWGVGEAPKTAEQWRQHYPVLDEWNRNGMIAIVQIPRGGPSQAFENLAQIEATVEQVLHLAEIAMRVLPEAEGVTSTGQRRLDVAQCSIEGQEGWVLGTGRTTAGDMRFRQDARAAHGLEAPRPSQIEVAGAARACSVATNGVLLGEPRPALPPRTSPPR